ncbi:molybdopterin molybdotransferase MoeA [Dactylosporangium matsuzakiense]|uniref:Molybdopterin molybdenumtransferase n=1 Tax=Dactylosporangium matsuzakiense TaxID=53360 RepID=A0A9W6NJK6_9ACTN|nr:molybdopterin molybdotransferase MoeA [Dactylosporangium matsuzakiense]GLK99127.1 molybdopterin molybdenumtransferase MoeA [Dactylosporangium matsuzakiense]
MTIPIAWTAAREAVFTAAQSRIPKASESVPLAEADGRTLAEPLVTLTDLPAFPTSSVDGWAARGPAPWRIAGRVLAGDTAAPLTEDGTCVEIATGGMVPAGTTVVVRIEDSSTTDGLVSGEPRKLPDWRRQGEEAAAGEELLAAGTPVTPGVIGLAASCGYDTLACRALPKAAVLVFGDELLTAGPPGQGRVRDALGPSVPSWLRRAGASVAAARGPVADTLDAHVAALQEAVDSGAQLICTTGGTMHGPVDHLHPALAELGARYVVNTVAVRPGFPMLVAQLPGGQFVAGLPGNPQSTFVALVSLVLPLLAGLAGRQRPELSTVTLGADVPGRGDFTHLALVTLVGGRAHPVGHVGSAMLRGLAGSVGFAVIPPGGEGHAGDVAQLVPLS